MLDDYTKGLLLLRGLVTVERESIQNTYISPHDTIL